MLPLPRRPYRIGYFELLICGYRERNRLERLFFAFDCRNMIPNAPISRTCLTMASLRRVRRWEFGRSAAPGPAGSLLCDFAFVCGAEQKVSRPLEVQPAVLHIDDDEIEIDDANCAAAYSEKSVHDRARNRFPRASLSGAV